MSRATCSTNSQLTRGHEPCALAGPGSTTGQADTILSPHSGAKSCSRKVTVPCEHRLTFDLPLTSHSRVPLGCCLKTYLGPHRAPCFTVPRPVRYLPRLYWMARDDTGEPD